MAERQRQRLIEIILNLKEENPAERAFLEMLTHEELEDLHAELALEDY